MTQFSSSTFGRSARGWLIGIGILEIVLAAAFVVGAMLLPAVDFGFYLTAGILGTVGTGLVILGVIVSGRAAAADRILREGRPGTARITGLTQTGMFLNQNPQVEMALEVEVGGEAPYAATVRQFVPLIMLGQLAPGAQLPVRVDRTDASRMAIDWSGGSAAAPMTPPTADAETLAQVQAALTGQRVDVPPVYGDASQAGYTLGQLRDHLRQHGLVGSATITRADDSGSVVGDERLFTIQATVVVPGRAIHTTKASAAMVPVAFAGKAAVGRTVPVRVAPDNPELVMFEWDQA